MLVAAPWLSMAMLRPSEQNCARSYMWTVHSLLQHLTACPWHAVDLPQASLRDALPHDGPWRPLAVHMGVVVVHNGCSYWSGSTRTFPLGPRMALAAHMRVLCVSCTAFVYNSTITSHILTQHEPTAVCCSLYSCTLGRRYLHGTPEACSPYPLPCRLW